MNAVDELRVIRYLRHYIWISEAVKMLIVELGVATQKNQVYNNTIICMGRKENNVNNDLNREVL